MWFSADSRDLLRAAALEYAGWHGWRVAPAYYPYTPGRHRRAPVRTGRHRAIGRWQDGGPPDITGGEPTTLAASAGRPVADRLPSTDRVGTGKLLWCACGQPGCPVLGGHPVSRDWLRDASTDPATIEFWWWGPRPWNVAVVAGERFDVWSAPAAVAERALAALGRAGRPLGPVAYGPDGRWLFFSQPRFGQPALELPAQLRYYGMGSYVLTPPSTQDAGRLRWWRPPSGPAAVRSARWESLCEALLAAVEVETYLARLG